MSLTENPTDKQKLNEDEIEEIVTNMAKKKTIDDDVLDEPTEEELTLREIEQQQIGKKQQTKTVEELTEEEKQGRKAKGKEMPSAVEKPAEEIKLAESDRREIREGTFELAENQPNVIEYLIKYWLEEGCKREAAILLHAIGAERASSILQNFKENEIEDIVSEMMKQETVDGVTLDAVFKKAHNHIHGEESVRFRNRLEGETAYVKQLLSETLGEIKSRDMMARLGIAEARAFDFITDYELDDVANFIVEMRENIIPLTLMHLRADQAAKVLAMLPEPIQPEVVVRTATLREVDLKTVGMLKNMLQEVVESSVPTCKFDGTVEAAEMLSRTDANVKEEVLSILDKRDSVLRDELEKRLFRFEGLLLMDDESLQVLFRTKNIQDKDIAYALKSCPPRLQEMILNNLSPAKKEDIEYMLETMGRVRVRDVELAQQRILKVAKELTDEGLISLDDDGGYCGKSVAEDDEEDYI